MVVMLGEGKAVLGGAVGEGYFAQDAGVHEDLDGAVHGGSAHCGEFAGDFFGGKAVSLLVEQAYDIAARGCDSVALVF